MEYIDKAEIAAAFEEAIINEELEVYYQPIVDPVTGRIMSAEALVRWIHPKKGFISPGIFVLKLEEDGSVSKLDRYVFQKVRSYISGRYEKRAGGCSGLHESFMVDFYDEDLMR